MIDLRSRSEQEELMDDFQGTSAELKIVLDDINRVNRILGGNSITLDAVFRMISENNLESYTILDVGCAEGTMLRELAKEARKRNIHVKLIGIDLNEDALEIAKHFSTDFPEIEYMQQDVLDEKSSNLACDIVTTTLTMHHFSDSDISIFTKRFSELARVGVIVNDLQRSTLAYYLFKLFSLFFIKTKTAKIDGLISISKGFKRNDLKIFANRFKNIKHDIQWKWAFRYVWVMRKNLRVQEI
ncbi:methyltransferase domain-containing protein [Maribacter sp. 2210JD10-5]|uniref:methyltransferase domain-containing protein n=1 Tax=Maribacter sp. 2210JD10-5 TaxID=3386272 RepID=UPI0039BD7D2D